MKCFKQMRSRRILFSIIIIDNFIHTIINLVRSVIGITMVINIEIKF